MLATNSRKVNPQHYISLQLQADLRAQNYNATQLYTLLGLLNNYIYWGAVGVGVITRDDEYRLVFHRKYLWRLFTFPTVTVYAVHTKKYLRKYWAGRALQGKKSVEKYRRVLSEVFKIYTLEDRDWDDPFDRHRRPNPMGEFNMVRAQELAHQIELLLHQDFDIALETLELDMSGVADGVYNHVRVEEKSFPKHKAATLKYLYDLSFGSLGFFWNRTGEGTPDAYGARDCAYKQNVGEPIPEVSEAIEKEFRSIQAEDKFEELCAFAPEREPEEILATEFVQITETELVESNDTTFIADKKIVEKIPLLNLVRRSMRVPPAEPPKQDSVSIPCWVLAESDRALRWWEKRISQSSLWLQNFAPPWVWGRLVPF